jgi:hypothetical protein
MIHQMVWMSWFLDTLDTAGLVLEVAAVFHTLTLCNRGPLNDGDA